MTLQECYSQLQGDYELALKRMRNEKMIGRYMAVFLEECTIEPLCAAVAAQDPKAAFAAVHALKGLAGNMCFTRLFEATSALTEQLRHDATTIDIGLYDDVYQTLEQTRNAINTYLA